MSGPAPTGSRAAAGSGGDGRAADDDRAQPGSLPRGRAQACVVCAGGELALRWRVRGEIGEAGLIPTTKEFGSALGDIVRCRSCGHMQLDSWPTQDELDAAYEQAESSDYLEEEAGQRASARSVLEQIEARAGRGRLVDLGCWVGFLVAEAGARGWQAVGVEPSSFASGYARERFGIDVRSDDMFTVDLPAGEFTAVVLGDVIEHLARPGDALDRASELLAPGGVLALELPDSGSLVARLLGRRWWSVIPTHLQYFTRASITRLLERHGYRVLYLGTDPKAFTIRYYLDKTGGYSSALARLLVGLAVRLGIADRMVAPDFRDRMLVIATRS
jgi:SAM-dependent methyltransferase